MTNKCPQCGASLPAGALEGLCPACLLAEGAAAETATQGGAPFDPPGLEEVARLFPQLEILAFIGKGGMGAVYKARQPALDRLVALKILPPQTAGDPGFAGRFNREARALAKLSHPNIVALHEFGQVDGLPFFIMEFVDGLNLRQLERAGKLSPREALQIVPQICEALQFAHDEGIVHRDIKPENILLDKKGRVKIADFGIAKIMGAGGDNVFGVPPSGGQAQESTARLKPELQTGLTGERAVGTPNYMAPEQVDRPQAVDHRADIYSLGVVFYEMLTGELPLGKFAPPSSRIRGMTVDVRLDEVVLRALEKEPEHRYQHASQVRTAVETIATASAPPSAFAGRIPGNMLGFDYRSKATLFGLPVLHVTEGVDPQTGRVRISKGIVAIGGRAQGVVAFGGMATGVFAFGGLAVGVFAFGGAALGLVSFGGLAIALIAAFGGLAVAPIAVGGLAIGYFADGGRGGRAIGAHVLDALTNDPAAERFFLPWAKTLMANLQWIAAIFIVLALGIGVGVPIWIRRRMGNLTGPPAAAPRRPIVHLRRGAFAGFWVFVIVAALAAFVTFLQPKVFVGVAEVTVRLLGAGGQEQDQIRQELALIQSSDVLRQVAADLDLSHRWAKKYGRANPLDDDKVVNMLRDHLGLLLVRNTALLDIKFYDDSPTEAAEIANKIAEAYRDLHSGFRLEIIDRAIAPVRPFRPNNPLNIILGLLLGAGLGIFSGIAVGLSSWWWTAKKSEDSKSASAALPAMESWFAMGFAGLSGAMGIVVFFRFPHPPAVLVWSILFTSLAGVGLAIPARNSRLGRRALIGACINMAIWLVVGIVSQVANVPSRLADTTAAADAPGIGAESGRQFRSVNGPPFTAQFAQGSVELLTLATASSHFPDTNLVQTWWRPDGTLSTNFDYEPGGTGSSGGTANSNSLYREFVLQAKGLPARASALQIVEMDPASGAMTGGAYVKGWPVSNTLMGFLQLPADAKTLHLRIGVAAGPWAADQSLRIPQNDTGSSLAFDHQGIRFQAGVQSLEEINGSTKIIANCSDVAGWQSELVLIDVAGKEWLPQESSQFTMTMGNPPVTGRQRQLNGKCEGLKLSQVKEIHFRIRPYQYVEFRNVSLQPSQATTVEIRDFANGNEVPVPVSQNLSFGPVTERVVYDYKSGKDWLLNLETGRTFSLPSGLDWDRNADAVWEWAHQQGVHVIGLPVISQNALYGFEMKAVLVKETNLTFENITSSQIPLELKGSPTSRSSYNGGPWLFQLRGMDWQNLYTFETDDGKIGVLQFTGFTDNPRGVKIRYKLVQTPNQAATTPGAAEPGAVLSEPPRLRFLAWQDEWKTNQPGAARHPDGSAVTDPEEIGWLKHVYAGGMNVSSLKIVPEPRFLHLWFSQPAFSRTSFNEVSLLDDADQPIKLGGQGSVASHAHDPAEENGNMGWLTCSLSPSEGTNLPTHVTVRLRYTIGLLELAQDVAPDYNGSMTLEGGSQLNGLGQNWQGRSFVAIAVDAKKMQARQFGVVAVAKTGREIPPTGWERVGTIGAGVSVANFDFEIPLAEVAKFRIGTRPIRTMEWKNVVLPRE